MIERNFIYFIFRTKLTYTFIKNSISSTFFCSSSHFPSWWRPYLEQISELIPVPPLLCSSRIPPWSLIILCDQNAYLLRSLWKSTLCLSRPLQTPRKKLFSFSLRTTDPFALLFYATIPNLTCSLPTSPQPHSYCTPLRVTVTTYLLVPVI